MTLNAPHMEKLFPELAAYNDSDYRDLGTSRPTLMIAMTARTGSSHLCSALSSAIKVGQPIELLNARDVLVAVKRKLNATSYAEILSAHIEGSTDYFVFKTGWKDFEYFTDKIFLMFPDLKIIYLNRLDVEAQAVSVVKALRSGKWHDSTEQLRKVELEPARLRDTYDISDVCTFVDWLNLEKKEWEQFFFRRDLEPIRICYESFCDDVSHAVRRITRSIGVDDAQLGDIKSTYKAVSDTVNDEWLARTRDYLSGKFYQRVKSAVAQDAVISPFRR